jgi:hypothetical protein
MKKNELGEFATDYLRGEGYEVSSSTTSAMSTSSLVNSDLLDKLDDETIRSNTIILLGDTIEAFDDRKEKSPTVRMIRDIDVRPALKKRFCSLPPFCK